MKTRMSLLVSLLAAVLLLLTACGGGMTAATQQPADGETFAKGEAPATEAFAEAPFAGPAEAGQVDAAGFALPQATAAVYNLGAPPPEAPAAAGRLIIKNADVRLLVADTDVAVDRATQIVGDLGGYIVSSRVWYQDYYGDNLKYATITIGVPVEQFERALSRMRGLSVQVLDESASGEDVTDQYVDLQSQVQNLEATRERIQSFLDQAQNVDEALRINQQLSEIERQIEQIKGQINFLSDRSAYSTLTINFEPELPEIVSTPTPTPVPDPWDPGHTFENARGSLTSAYQGILDFLIWFLVAFVPIVAPPLLIAWFIWRMLTRQPASAAKKESTRK
ncbi:MAG TPA: DUF4349 domain-containing protein [Anaerolineales bacterium]|jgi:ABC-type phosphate transport system auxiliary subunit